VFKLIEAASGEPVTVAELKSQLRITHTEQDTMLGIILKAARQWAEDFLRYQILSATWELYFDAFPIFGSCIWIQKSPVTAITSIKYINSAGTLIDWSSSEYSADFNTAPCRIYEKYGYMYPTPQATKNAVVVKFVTGYVNAAAVPEVIKLAILMKASTMYENPSDEVSGTQVNKLDLTSERLLWPYRAIRF
jgi:uncharacterized phiE125 gp8 family phage protein